MKTLQTPMKTSEFTKTLLESKVTREPRGSEPGSPPPLTPSGALPPVSPLDCLYDDTSGLHWSMTPAPWVTPPTHEGLSFKVPFSSTQKNSVSSPTG